jgi:hypothetical protein
MLDNILFFLLGIYLGISICLVYCMNISGTKFPDALGGFLWFCVPFIYLNDWIKERINKNAS